MPYDAGEMNGAAPATLVDSRARAARRGRSLLWLTIAWNSAECVIAMAAGVAAGSVALVGFGLDSAIEVTASLAGLWRIARDADECAREAAERRSVRIIGVCFLALAVYVLYEAATALAFGRGAERSGVGIALAALSLVVMPALAYGKRRVATQLQSGAL